MNATEITLNAPAKNSPTAVVISKPVRTVSMIEKISRNDRTANHSITTMIAIISPAIGPAFSVSVANSSSEIGTGPVRRTRTPWSGVSCSWRTAARIASVACLPGIRAA